jgi:DNA-binding NarL/FixJ family response regulator
MDADDKPALLLVEDDPAVARALHQILVPFGEVVAAASVASAKRALERRRGWRAFVLDLCLPDGDGLDVLEHARARGFHQPALVLTGTCAPEPIARAFDLDASYLVKPAPAARIEAFARAASKGGLHREVVAWSVRHRLTPAESSVLFARVSDVARDAFIEERGITRGTYKRHVHNILAKTGDATLDALALRVLGELRRGG